MEDAPEEMKRRPRCSLSRVFEPLPREIAIDKEIKLLTNTNTSAQMAAPAMPFTVNEVQSDSDVESQEDARI